MAGNFLNESYSNFIWLVYTPSETMIKIEEMLATTAGALATATSATQMPVNIVLQPQRAKTLKRAKWITANTSIYNQSFVNGISSFASMEQGKEILVDGRKGTARDILVDIESRYRQLKELETPDDANWAKVAFYASINWGGYVLEAASGLAADQLKIADLDKLFNNSPGPGYVYEEYEQHFKPLLTDEVKRILTQWGYDSHVKLLAEKMTNVDITSKPKEETNRALTSDLFAHIRKEGFDGLKGPEAELEFKRFLSEPVGENAPTGAVPKVIVYASDFIINNFVRAEFTQAQWTPANGTAIFEAMYGPYALDAVLKKAALLEALHEKYPELVIGSLATELAEMLIMEALRNGEKVTPEQLRKQLKELEKDLLFAPQCFLIRNIEKLSKYNQKRIVAKACSLGFPKYEKIFLARGPSELLLSKLKARKNENKMLSFAPDKLSALVPTLRIFKVTYEENTRKIKDEIELKFPNYTNVSSKDDFLGLALGNNGGDSPFLTRQSFGIKSFSWEFISTNPYTIKNDITANLVLYFQDFGVFSQKRTDTKTKTNYSYSDLVIPSSSITTKKDKNTDTVSPEVDDDYVYDIKVVTGWAVPYKSNTLFSSGELDSIRATQEVFFLTKIDYDLNFSQDGTFELSLEYRARMETSVFDKRANVLYNKIISEALEKISSAIKEKRKKDCDRDSLTLEKDKKEIEELEELRAGVKKDRRVEIYQTMLNQMIDNECIYFEDLTAIQILSSKGYTKFEAKDVFDVQPDDNTNEMALLADALNAKSSDDSYKAFENAIGGGAADDGEDYRIHYFFLGDLFEIAAKQALQEDNFSGDELTTKRTQLILSDMTIPNPLSAGNPILVNMASIPVDVNLYSQFMYDEVISKKRDSFSLISFIKSFTAYVLINRMQDCFGTGMPKLRFRQAYISLPQVESKDPVRSLTLASKVVFKEATAKNKRNRDRIFSTAALKPEENIPMKNTPNKQLKDQWQYIVVYQESTDPSLLMIRDGDYPEQVKEDVKRGIYHLFLGSRDGILKNANFSKTEQKFLREQRFSQNSQDSFSFLANVFDVDLNLYGTNLFFPGQYLYINPRAIGNIGNPYTKGHMAHALGLGGYHLVTKVGSTIESGKFETHVTARWETGGSGKFRNPNNVGSSGDSCEATSPDSNVQGYKD